MRDTGRLTSWSSEEKAWVSSRWWRWGEASNITEQELRGILVQRDEGRLKDGSQVSGMYELHNRWEVLTFSVKITGWTIWRGMYWGIMINSFAHVKLERIPEITKGGFNFHDIEYLGLVLREV